MVPVCVVICERRSACGSTRESKISTYRHPFPGRSPALFVNSSAPSVVRAEESDKHRARNTHEEARDVQRERAVGKTGKPGKGHGGIVPVHDLSRIFVRKGERSLEIKTQREPTRKYSSQQMSKVAIRSPTRRIALSSIGVSESEISGKQDEPLATLSQPSTKPTL